nr:hypothetical protein [Tanacetum cinerariifolium]
MNPRRPTMNGARPYKTFFQTPSFETRPFHKSSAVNNSYRAPWVPTVNRIETVFRISNCLVENQVKFAICTLLAGALTWWNSHVRIIGIDAAYVMTWIELKKKMADMYCPRNEMKRLRLKESDRVERYIGGLPDSIHGSVAASKPKTMQEATEMATGIMDKKIRTYAERQDANKRKSPTNANVANNQRGNGAGQKVTCYECGAQGHFKRYCPKLKNNNNNNRGNLVGTRNAQERVYAVGNAGTNSDANTVTVMNGNPSRVNIKQLCGRGRLLASFQDLEHKGGDTRSQGGIRFRDNDIKIKIQDHKHANGTSKGIPKNTRLLVSRRLKKDSLLNNHPLGGDC